MADIDIFINRNKNLNRGYRKLEVWKESIYLFAFVKKKIKLSDSISFKTRAQIEASEFQHLQILPKGILVDI